MHFFNKNIYNDTNLISRIFIVCIAILIPIWSIAHTIALRNILIFTSLSLLLFCDLKWSVYKGRLTIFYVLIAYLLIHIIFISDDSLIAAKNFRSEWLKFIICFVLGLGAALVCQKQKMKSELLWIGILFSVPLVIHLFLAMYSWLHSGTGFPWGFTSFNTRQHGDLGYASLASAIFLVTYLLFEASAIWQVILALISLIFCIFSPLIALSRGGFIFCVFSISIVTIYKLYYEIFVCPHKSFTIKNIAPLLMLILTILVAAIGVKTDYARWKDGVSKLQITALSKQDSFRLACDKDFTNQDNINFSNSGANRFSKEAIFEGDGSRLIGQITGLKLAMENPMGINQSRYAYQIALTKHCNYQPKFMLSHSHNGWINASLSIGIFGVLILWALIFKYLKIGITSMIDIGGQTNSYAIALFFGALIWLIRSFFDGALQDQMLEMQGFIFSFLFGMVILGKRRKHKNYLHAADSKSLNL